MSASSIQRKPFSLSPAMLVWIALLAILLTIGIVSAVQVFWDGLIITNMSDTIPWGLWITIDLASIALGAGAFTLSAIVYIFGLKKFQSIIRLAVFVGFVGYSSASAHADHGYRSPRSFLASLGLLECALSSVGNHVVYHDLPDDHDHRIRSCAHRAEDI